MALSLNGTSNGSLNNLSLSGNTGTVIDTARAGGIIQVVQVATSSQVLVNTNTYTDTALSASITPSSSTNKVLIMIMQEFVATRASATVGMGIRLLRDSTVIWNPVASGTGPFMYYNQGGGDTSQELDGNAMVNYLDSPATTSEVTYKTQGRPHTSGNSGAVTFQYNSNGTNPTSTIILMEVVA